MIQQRKDRISKLKQIVGNMQQQLNSFKSQKAKPERKRDHSNKKSQDNKHQTSKRSMSRQESQQKSIEKKGLASPQKLAQKSMNTPQRWKLKGKQDKKSLEKLWMMSEVIDTQFYTSLDHRKSPPKSKKILNSIEIVDKNYYHHHNRSTGQQQTQIENKHSQSVNEMLLSKRQRAKIFPEKLKPAQTDRQQKPADIDRPQQYAISRRNKITRSVQRFLEAPMSNKNLYFYGNKGIISKGKGRISPEKNKSSIYGGQARMEIPSLNSKKHFSRYFCEHYGFTVE